METQLLIKREESIERDLKFKLIPYDPQKEEEDELKQLEQLERDVLTLSEIMKEFGCAVEIQGENLEKVDTEVKEAIISVETGNDQIKEAVGIKTEIIATKLGIATVVAIGINTPIGLILGTKVLIGTILASGVVTALWMRKT
jgi:hypothetical protein